MNRSLKACIFDLDGVLVDTAKFHYLAWSRLADELDITGFNEEENERLKGVSRMRSLEIILEIGGITLDDEQKLSLATKKNNWYREYLKTLTEKDVLPGVISFLEELKQAGWKIGLGSASKNARLIIDQIGIAHYFEAIVDGLKTTKAKPDPQVFLMGAQELEVAPAHCVVFEDSIAGIEAAKTGGMAVIGIGSVDILTESDITVPSLEGMSIRFLEEKFAVFSPTVRQSTV